MDSKIRSMGLGTFDDSDRWHQQQNDQRAVEQLAYKPKKKKQSGDDMIEQLAQQYYADAMRGASAIGQQMGQSLNRRGLGDSPLAAGIQSQAMNQALGRAQSEVAKMRLGHMTQQDAIKRQEQMQSDQMLYQLLSTIFGVGFRVAEKKGLFDGFLPPSGVDLDYDAEDVRTLGGLEGLDPITSVADPNVFGRPSPRLGRGVDDRESGWYDYGDNPEAIGTGRQTLNWENLKLGRRR